MPRTKNIHKNQGSAGDGSLILTTVTQIGQYWRSHCGAVQIVVLGIGSLILTTVTHTGQEWRSRRGAVHVLAQQVGLACVDVSVGRVVAASVASAGLSTCAVRRVGGPAALSAWDAPGRKRRRLVSKARDPFAGDDEPPAAHPEPFRGIRSGRRGGASSRSGSAGRSVPS